MYVLTHVVVFKMKRFTVFIQVYMRMQSVQHLVFYHIVFPLAFSEAINLLLLAVFLRSVISPKLSSI